MPRRPPTRRAVRPGAVALGVGIPLSALAVVVAASLFADGDGDGDDGRPAASTTTSDPSGPAPRVDGPWNRDLASALRPLEDVLVELAATVDRHATGGATDAELAATLDRVRPVLVSVREAVAGLPAHPDDALAHPLVSTTAQLYVHAVEAHTASAVAADDVRPELDKLGRRLRILADRTFDRARERTSAPVDLGDDIRVVHPAEVPDWERLELAVGPPLEPSDPNRSDDLPLERRDDRRSQPADDWLNVVDALEAPRAAEVRAAPAGGHASLARRLVAAAEALRDVPVPDGDRGRADRVAIGWLLRADAARAAQLATVAPTVPGLGELADALLTLSAGEAFAPRPSVGGG